MRMVRFEQAGVTRPGALIDDGAMVVDLQAAAASYLHWQGDPRADAEARLRLPEDTAEFLVGGHRSMTLAQAAIDHACNRGRHRFCIPRTQVRLAVPIQPPQIVCGGGNFWGHLRESGRERPEHVEFFLKSSATLIGPEDDLPYQPWISQKLDYEAELGIVIGRRGYRIPRERALEYVFGYTAVNDLAIRDRQLARWRHDAFQVKYGNGKVFDHNLALGPAIVTADEITDPMDLSIRCWVDAQLRQDSSTREYIWGIAEVIEYYSSMMTLEPGTLICPGTPGGCAVGSDPECGGRSSHAAPASEYLRPGQIVSVEIGGVGHISNAVRDVSSDRSR
jgi:acylpyruvate hydrolase